MSIISCQNIIKKFDNLEVLKGIDLSVNKGEVVSIVGPSGAGKTTLLQILSSLDKPTSGEVFIGDTNLTSLNEKQMAQFRNQSIGFIFQFHQLLPEFTALENVMMPALIGKMDKPSAEKNAKELMEFLGISHRLEHKPAEMSGGEKQRVAVARALINKPAVVFADEPTGSLDYKNKEELQALFLSLRQEFNHTFVIVTHDMHLAEKSDRVIALNDGLITN